MNLEGKISLVVSVLDELVTVGYLTNKHLKLQAVDLIRQNLKDYVLPPNPTKADTTILALQKLAMLNHSDLNKHLAGLATLSEKALSELHDQYADIH